MNKDIVQKEALSTLYSYSRCGVGISVGVGKTLIALKHLEANYKPDIKVLVVAPKKSIYTSWIDDSKKFNLEYLLKNIEFTTYLSLNKKDLNYDIIYLDEAHSLKLNHDSWLSKYNGKILGLTGTPPRDDKSEKAYMINKYCPIVYRYIIKEAVNDKILNDYRIVVHTVYLDNNKNIKLKHGNREWYSSETEIYDYWSKRINDAKTKKEQQIMNVMRMKAIMDFPSKLHYAKSLLESSPNKCIVFANTQEQADKLCKDSFHSNNTDSEDNLIKFKNDEINRLSCVLQLNEGVNIPNLKEGIIMHAYGNERKSVQRIGRLLRLNPNDTAIVRILCYMNTVDEKWVSTALLDFDNDKIMWVNDNEL
jgi:superfamily II DNA or RNA helicase